MLIASIILLIIGFLGIICAILCNYQDNPIFYIGAMFSLCLIPGTILYLESFSPKTPTDQDVLNGKAIYVETTHICQNDTTKTYRLEWKQND